MNWTWDNEDELKDPNGDGAFWKEMKEREDARKDRDDGQRKKYEWSVLIFFALLYVFSYFFGQ